MEQTKSAHLEWRDLGFLSAYVLAAFVFVGNLHTGPATLLAPLLTFGLVPLADALLGVESHNPAARFDGERAQGTLLRALLWAWVPVQLVLLSATMWHFATAELSPLVRFAVIVSTGIATGGVGITIAHELGHRSGFTDRWCARLLLASVCYAHFTVEHNRGHHIRVATPEDPATARLGESLWWFVLRNLPQQYFSAWKLDNARLRRRGIPAFSVKNHMIWIALSVPALGALAWLAFGPLGALFFYGQSLTAIFLLEGVNYLEHYGLVRKQTSPGKYERVTPWHSWNASYPVSNRLLFHLQRHADHHANAGRRYPILRHIEDAPQLPAGYPTMPLLALFPPLWRRVMDPRVIAVRQSCGTWPPG